MSAHLHNYPERQVTTTTQKHARLRSVGELAQQKFSQVDQANRLLDLNLVDRKSMVPITPGDAIEKYRRAMVRPARDDMNRGMRVAAVGKALVVANVISDRFRRIDVSVPKQGATLADEGKAALARSGIYYENCRIPDGSMAVS